MYGGANVIIYCQSLQSYFWCRKLMTKPLGHALESLSFVSEFQANDSTCHPFING
jgi:hypothetical protein